MAKRIQKDYVAGVVDAPERANETLARLRRRSSTGSVHDHQEDLASSPTSSTASPPRGVVVPKLRTGLASVDMELLVLERSMKRLKKAATYQPEMAVELTIVEHSIDRMVRGMREELQAQQRAMGGAGTGASPSPIVGHRSSVAESPFGEHVEERSLSLNGSMTTHSTKKGRQLSFAGEPGSPLDNSKRKRSVVLAELPPMPTAAPLSDPSDDDEEEEEHHRRARPLVRCIRDAMASQDVSKKLWGSVLQVATQADGLYRFSLDFEDAQNRSTELLEEAAQLGMKSIAETLVLRHNPILGVHGLRVPDHVPLGYPAPAEFDNVLLPPGIVSFATKRDQVMLASSSSVWGRTPHTHILDPGLKPFMTGNFEHGWIAVDFGAAVIVPEAYGFASVHEILPGYFPRSWRVLGSLDGDHWQVLREHENDDTFRGRLPARIWSLDDRRVKKSVKSNSAAQRFRPDGTAHSDDDDSDGDIDDAIRNMLRYMRIEITGPNSFGTHELQVSAIEVYGTYIATEPLELEMPELEGTTETEGRPAGFKHPKPAPEPYTRNKSKKK